MLFWLNKSRSKNNKPAVYLRLSVGDKRVELSTYQYVAPESWNTATQSVKGNPEETQAINRRLVTLKANLHRHYSHLVASGKRITAQSVKNSFSGITEHSRTLCEVIHLPYTFSNSC
ncbi:Arm DNA-binding domain-containing protein [Chitinophaga niastensis]|uniref:Arm DNA-binding domain-containing protein n=1 Tax=Chitinophaga niastensis TaxID=536980 RepID=UPI000D0D7432